ncbi:MAG: hypothetical protein JSR79_08170 [Proteobacteria bacterium]|nr:hypothetical protein [Pseudomonadota bacterium]
MGNVWDRTTEFLSANGRALSPIVLAALLAPNSVNALVGGAGPETSAVMVQLVTLACVLIALWGQLAVVALALDPAGVRPRATAAATGRFGRAVAAMLVLLVIFALLAAPVIGTMAANGVDLSALRTGGLTRANLTGGVALFVSLYSIALVVAVLFVTVRLALLYPVIVAEGGVVAAIRRAWALSRGMVWKMIGVWLLFVIVYLVAAAAITSAVGVALGLLTDMQNPFSAGRIVIAILSGAVTTAFTLIVAAFSAKLYLAALAAREGASAA